MARNLNTKILFSFFVIIVVFGLLTFMIRLHIIKNDIINQAQKQVKYDLHAASSVYEGEIEKIKMAFSLIPVGADLDAVKNKLKLDYIYLVTNPDKNSIQSEIVEKAFSGKAVGGTRIISKEELNQLPGALSENAKIDIRDTPKSFPTNNKVLDTAMAIEYALPRVEKNGFVKEVVVGGKIINRDITLVDQIKDLVFENKLYDGKPLGTVTVFLGGVRISTNVLDQEGNRAIGTKVSEKVYNKVIKEGKYWIDRAFVVTDWYLTAYQPIRDIKGNVIGILYVGSLEKPFKDREKKVLLAFLTVIILVALLAAILAYFLAKAISHPVTDLLKATTKISDGETGFCVNSKSSVKELSALAQAFNSMSEKLSEREKSLKIYNEKLSSLNKNYLDLVEFVSHELKGILSSTILNAYSLRDGFLGLINFKQRKAMDSVTRNLDYLESTVKNFLNLGRIEKNEITVNKAEVLLREDIFTPAVEAFLKAASEKELEIINNISPDLKIHADEHLLQIVANNLISNAVKYTHPGGKIILNSQAKGATIEVEVYNDGTPIREEETEKLFKKFSRLDSARKAQGTGLGLFITNEIIARHNGKLWHEAREKGNSFIFNLKGENKC